MTSKRIALAAGGTGGHIFPAEAVASNLIKEGYSCTLITDKRYKKSLATNEQLLIKVIATASPSSKKISKIIALLSIFVGTIQSLIILFKLKADVVVGFGGYPAYPTMLAAKILGKTIIIHEQNAVLGRVNRAVAKWSKHIATCFDEVKFIKDSDTSKVTQTGNPVRNDIIEISKNPYNFNDEKINILITGGSQGAKIFSDIVPDAILKLPDNIKSKIKIIQQCRAEDIARVKEQYIKNNIDFEVKTFFDNIAQRLNNCHLVIARAGASTVAELLVAKRPSILIPYLYAMDNHQMVNAQRLEKHNACIIVSQKEANSAILAQKLVYLTNNPQELKQMSDDCSKLANIEATNNLAKLIIVL